MTNENVWLEYERRKKLIRQDPCADYEREIKALIEELGV